MPNKFETQQASALPHAGKLFQMEQENVQPRPANVVG